AVVVGCRGIPVQAAAFSTTQMPRSQNLRETTFLQLLVHTRRALGQAAVLRCDRGCRRTSWLRHGQEWRPAFVVRLIPHVMLDTGPCGSGACKKRLRGICAISPELIPPSSIRAWCW